MAVKAQYLRYLLGSLAMVVALHELINYTQHFGLLHADDRPVEPPPQPGSGRPNNN